MMPSAQLEQLKQMAAAAAKERAAKEEEMAMKEEESDEQGDENEQPAGCMDDSPRSTSKPTTKPPDALLGGTLLLAHLGFEQRWHHLRAVIYPAGAQLAYLFGFQHERVHQGATVPSNLDNQVDHLCTLVLNIMDRQGYESFSEALHHAVSSLHRHMLRNYGRWLRHVGLAHSADGRKAGDKMHTCSGALSQNRTWAFLGPWEFMRVEEEQVGTHRDPT